MASITQLSAFIIAVFAMLGTLLLVPFLPFVPGPALAWLIAVMYALVDRLATLGWGALILLTGLMLLGVSSGIWLPLLGVKAGGGDWRSAFLSLIAGVIGFIIFPPFGGIIAAAIAAAIAEWVRRRNMQQAIKAGGGSVGSWLLATVIEFMITLLMLVVFIGAIMLALVAG